MENKLIEVKIRTIISNMFAMPLKTIVIKAV